MKIAFLHGGDPTMASYRYRASRIAEALGASLNHLDADVLVFAKPHSLEFATLQHLKAEGKRTIVDFCDVHWGHPAIRAMLDHADAVTANTPFMAQLILEDTGRLATVIPDPYEYEECEPHCNGNRCLWFGHSANGDSVNRLTWILGQYPLTIVSNAKKVPESPIEIIPWSLETMREEFAKADLVLMPETSPHKSANRTIEAVRQGCFVVAEPHPSLEGFPGIWVGNIQKGIAWAIQHPAEARQRTRQAQDFVRDNYSLAHSANAWKTLLTELRSTSAADTSIGRAGSTLTASMAGTAPIS